MSKSVSFDRIVDTYDQTRGGFPVGRTFADAVMRYIPPAPARIVELGVGTGLVALPLTEHGYAVVGVDLSSKMIAVARDRIGAGVAIGDASRAPIASASCDAVVAARILHVVGDPGAALLDAARIVRPHGRIVVILAGSTRTEQPRDDIDEATMAMHAGRLRGPNADTVIELALATGALELVDRGLTDALPYDESPRDHADKIRNRSWSGFWEIDDETWARAAEPAMERLLALPDPDRPRRRERSQSVCVFERS
jgi:ubiquinone/menaquinone biosynthesis C-methylase UbiE